MINTRQSDIAKKLNISRVTVSKALRDHPDISVSMKKKVRDTALKMGYIPNLIARQLNARKTYTIGVVVPDLENSFFAYTADSIIDYATQEDYRVILSVSREKESVERKNIENLIGMRVDGLLVCISQETSNKEIYSQIKRMKIPLVFFDRVFADCGFSSVVFNDQQGAVSALDQVIKAGFKKVAHFAGYSSINIGKERLTGYKASLRKHGISLKKEWIIEGGYELKDGSNAFRNLYSLGDMPEIILAVNDRVALGAYLEARKLGIRIPSDIGIMAYGFGETTDIFSPPLSVINQDPRKLGILAAKTLLSEIKGESENKPFSLSIDEEFIWKKSLRKSNNKRH
jgi:LacI family transcriptional regulator